MQRLIWPMRTISFSQLENSAYSHKNIPAVDMTGEDTGIDYCYAPCDLEIINIPKSNEAHTIYYASTDCVMCADGQVRYVTIALSHANNIKSYKVGQKFKSGDIIYTEGTAGQATGNHVHMEVANGRHPLKQYVVIDGNKYWRFSLDDALMPTQVFFALDGWNKTRKLMGVELVWCKSRIYYPAIHDMRLKLYTTKGKQGVRETISFGKNNKTNAKLLAVIPKGNGEAIITGFVSGIQKDGYQWISVNYNGIEGYCQWDSQWFEVYEY